MMDAGEDEPADANLTLENWSSAATAPSAGGASSSSELKSGMLLAGRYEILDRLGGGIELVGEQQARTLAGQEVGHRPMGAAVAVDVGQTAQIDRIELHGPHVEESNSKIARHLGDDLRLAYAARASDV